MSGNWLASLTLAVIVLGLGWRAAELARTSPFTVGYPEYRRSTIWARDLEFAHRVGPGVMRVRATRAFPGHETVGYFRLGPSTFLELREVTASFSSPEAMDWQVTGRVARLASDAIVFTETPRLENSDGIVQRCREIEISFGSGRVRVR